MKCTIFIDIETLPALNLFASGSPPVKLASSDENHLKTDLNGDFSRLLCIGFIDQFPRNEIERVVVGQDARHGAFHCDERIVLTEFWLHMNTFRPNIDRILGHYVYALDLKFILKRSVVHGVRPMVDLSFARYRNQPIFDTMYEWERCSYGSQIGLEALARALGAQSRSSEARAKLALNLPLSLRETLQTTRSHEYRSVLPQAVRRFSSKLIESERSLPQSFESEFGDYLLDDFVAGLEEPLNMIELCLARPEATLAEIVDLFPQPKGLKRSVAWKESPLADHLESLLAEEIPLPPKSVETLAERGSPNFEYDERAYAASPKRLERCVSRSKAAPASATSS